MDAMKEKAANVAASAKAGMEKTKAVVQEKVQNPTSNVLLSVPCGRYHQFLDQCVCSGGEADGPR